MRMKILDNLLKGRKMQKAQVWHFGPSLGTEQPGGAIMRLTFWEQPKLFYSHLIFSEQGLGSADMIMCSKSNTKLNIYSTFPSWDWKYMLQVYISMWVTSCINPLFIGCSVTLKGFDAEFFPCRMICTILSQILWKSLALFLRGRFISPLQ